MEPVKIGIALAGGGARGIAHVGVLQALEENGISPQYISGASMGAIVGALYAAGHKPGHILKTLKSTSILQVARVGIPLTALSDLDKLAPILEKQIPIDSFESLEKRLFVSVTNLTRGEAQIIKDGPLFEPILASSSVPLVFSTRTIKGEVFTDGGVLNNLPVAPLRQHCDVVIGVNVTPIVKTNELKDAIDVSYRTLDLVLWSNVEDSLTKCDVIVEPPTARFRLFDFDKADEIYQLGYEAGLREVSRIRHFLDRKTGSATQDPVREAGADYDIPILSDVEHTVESAASALNKGAKLVGRSVNRLGTRLRDGSRSILGTNTAVRDTPLSEAINLPPGTLFYVGRKRIGPTLVNLLSFNEKEVVERSNLDLEELATEVRDNRVSWVNVDGVHNPDAIGLIAELFDLHLLTAEDIVQTQQRPRLEIRDEYLYLVVKMISLDKWDQKIDIEQVSVVLGNNWVLTFQEKSEDVFEPLRQRIRKSQGRVRRRPADYLFFAILDVMVDHYARVNEEMESRIEDLERKVDSGGQKGLVGEIQELKKGLLYLLRAVRPLQLVANELSDLEHPLMSEEAVPYFEDLRGQVTQVIEHFETQRSVLDTLMEQYISVASFRSNEVMRVLTIVATIFIPLTFIVGVYGMNFTHMPELGYRYGYHIVWGVMILVTLGLLVFFRRKRWL